MLAREHRGRGNDRPDHVADAIRYGCLRQELTAQVKLVRER